jgi:DnaJ-class molecular chaperone
MNCSTCFGIGEVLVDERGEVVSRLRDAAMMVPCPDCGGSGKIHCCEGDRAEPEPQE